MRRRTGKIAILVVTVALMLTAAIRQLSPNNGGPSSPTPPKGSHLTVVASFYPLAYFAERLGSSRAHVVNLTPHGSSPHDWEPKISDMRLLRDADLFLYNGLGFEPWATQVLESLDRSELVTINTSDDLPLESEMVSPSTPVNPHVWLDPVLAQHQVKRILAGMIAVDPAGREVYEEGAYRLLDDLAALDKDFTALGSCANDTIVISHDYLSHVAQRYGFQTIPLMGLAAESEPTPRQLGQIVSTMRERNIKHIFDEPLVNSRATQEVAKSTGATVLFLDPIENLSMQESEPGRDYLTVMRENLSTLKLALGCS